MSITPLDSIRRAIARRNGVADPAAAGSGIARAQGGRIENGLFPASHTAEELARIQELSQRNAGGPDSSQATRRRRERDREPGPVRRMVNAWWNRLLGAVYGGGFSMQEAEYEEHATSRDYLWNTLDTAVWGLAFPLLTIVSTQLVGAEEAGKFSIAFVTGTLIMIACNYGVRNFQVSDIDEKTSFASYRLNRWLCGALALGCGLMYSSARGYDAQMATIGLGVYLYKVIDGVADVYEGRLQQADKLYLAGMSQTLRSVGVIAVFSVALFLTRSMSIAAMAMGIAAIASLVLVTAPLALLETEKSRRVSLREVGHLFVQCAPLFGALFLFNLIESMPKFVMEGTLAYKYQLYFNALFFPAQAILLSIGFVYKPQLLRLSSIWANPRKRRRFDLIIVAVMALIVVITGVCAAFMAGPGIPLMSFMYGLSFERYHTLALLMVVAGGDGTVNYAVNAMKRKGLDIPIGVIPAGTANDFAGAVGMSREPLEAARQIASGAVDRVDVGRVNDLYFVNIFSFGIFTTTSQRTPDERKHKIGKLAYIIEGSRSSARCTPCRWRSRPTASGSTCGRSWCSSSTARRPADSASRAVRRSRTVCSTASCSKRRTSSVRRWPWAAICCGAIRRSSATFRCVRSTSYRRSTNRRTSTGRKGPNSRCISSASPEVSASCAPAESSAVSGV